MADGDSVWFSLGKGLLSLLFNRETEKKGKLAPTELSVTIPIGADAKTEKPVVQNAPKLDKVSDFVLNHNRFCPDGIFGELKTGEGQFVAYTLEHSYNNKPKLADGDYTCIRGPHRLHGMTEDFITFEIKGVPDFDGKSVTGILFHWGNYNKDSEGCVLLGSSVTPEMITHSRQTWADFMNYVNGKDNFTLTVIST